MTADTLTVCCSECGRRADGDGPELLCARCRRGRIVPAPATTDPELTARVTDTARNLATATTGTVTGVVGVDPSLTATGVALLSRECRIDTLLAAPAKGKRNDPMPSRRARIGRVAAAVAEHVEPGNLVVIEGPSHGSVGGSAWDRAGLWWQIVADALDRGATVAVAAPPTRAKWATGNGRADKAAVASAMARLTERDYDNADEADAAALALMGGQRIGWWHGSKARNGCLGSVQWPDDLPEVVP